MQTAEALRPLGCRPETPRPAILASMAGTHYVAPNVTLVRDAKTIRALPKEFGTSESDDVDG